MSEENKKEVEETELKAEDLETVAGGSLSLSSTGGPTADKHKETITIESWSSTPTR